MGKVDRDKRLMDTVKNVVMIPSGGEQLYFAMQTIIVVAFATTLTIGYDDSVVVWHCCCQRRGLHLAVHYSSARAKKQ